MAKLTIQFSSNKLATQTTVRILLPDHPIKNNLPVIWWLHGLGDNGSVWLRKTRLELIAGNYDVAIILPDMQRSFYQNIENGLPYFDYLTSELPKYLQSILPLSSDQKNTYLVGNSMGGYGAYKWAFSKPQRFSYVAVLSPVTDLKVVPSLMPDSKSIIGSNPEEMPSLIRLMKPNKALLSDMHWLNLIGKDDFLLSDDESFVKEADTLGIDLNSHVLKGKHDWTFWDKQLEQIFNWLPLAKQNRES